MANDSNKLEAIKLMSDWAKWLVAIETAAIAIIGGFFAGHHSIRSNWSITFATLAIASFMISITAAAVLLLTLPEIVQKLQPGEDIWLTKDHVAKRLFHVNTKSLALIESYFFGSGLVFTIVMIVIAMWS